jgi:hypothetical protein
MTAPLVYYPRLWYITYMSHRLTQLDRLERKLDALSYGVFKMSAEMDALRASVTSQKTVVDGVATMLTDLSERLKAAIADDDPAALQAIVADVDANTKALADAVVANTAKPADPAPAPVDVSDPNAPQPT